MDLPEPRQLGRLTGARCLLLKQPNPLADYFGLAVEPEVASEPSHHLSVLIIGPKGVAVVLAFALGESRTPPLFARLCRGRSSAGGRLILLAHG